VAAHDGDALAELVGVYHADGGPVGEVRYVLGKLLGTAHCALCDVTHSPVRRKPEWDRMVLRLGVPFTLLHLNEMPADVARGGTGHRLPVVLARLSDGTLHPVLTPSELDGLGGPWTGPNRRSGRDSPVTRGARGSTDGAPSP